MKSERGREVIHHQEEVAQDSSPETLQRMRKDLRTAAFERISEDDPEILIIISAKKVREVKEANGEVNTEVELGVARYGSPRDIYRALNQAIPDIVQQILLESAQDATGLTKEQLQAMSPQVGDA